MSTSNLNKYIINFLIILLGLSGWITSVFIYNDIENQRKKYQHVCVANAENILFQSLGSDVSSDNVVAKISQWKKDGWTAQTGSLTTVCKYHPDAFLENYSQFTESIIEDICKNS